MEQCLPLWHNERHSSIPQQTLGNRNQMNPQHVVPTIDDNGYVLWESRAINSYLVNKYGCMEGARLLPADLQQRSMVDRMLYFDIGTLYASMVHYFGPQLIGGELPDPVRGADLERSLGLLDMFLCGKKYVAGTCGRTLADLSLLASVTQLEGYEYSYDQHRHVAEWACRLKGEMPYYGAVNDAGLAAARRWASSRLQHHTRKN